ncbi:MAG: hypothetical protein LBV79_02010, partial [Candidatus Adiutrix sp.]|nr:hypothetical protein [Candidatus Adiutrix sp.]
ARDDFDQWGRLALEPEKALLGRVESLEHKTGAYLEAGDFDGLMGEIASLRGPVDKFFDEVLVDDPDPEVKEARVALLSRAGRIFELIADFSRISTV